MFSASIIFEKMAFMNSEWFLDILSQTYQLNQIDQQPTSESDEAGSSEDSGEFNFYLFVITLNNLSIIRQYIYVLNS